MLYLPEIRTQWKRRIGKRIHYLALAFDIDQRKSNLGCFSDIFPIRFPTSFHVQWKNDFVDDLTDRLEDIFRVLTYT